MGHKTKLKHLRKTQMMRTMLYKALEAYKTFIADAMLPFQNLLQ
ncbi:uncharacterized protein G2W53_003872 [Senna tora]|uniref:Uncharacterized protein n=1 Tax=Senna tora TaxID=362788 RepID=A0A835CGS9_9FABA|nr:uncharacterized protein G2W53_003872 [Senna tora]